MKINRWDDGTFLYHYGIPGQKWGVRRFQNFDGTYTEEGKKRKRQITFISGSSKTQDTSSEYYRKTLPKEIQKEIDKCIKRGDKILVGDAPGIDRQVQDYLARQKYKRVEVYSPGTTARYLANSNWRSRLVDAPEFEVGSKEWLAKKDIAMSKAATRGLAVVLENGGAGATRKNVERLLNDNKDVKVYELHNNKHDDQWIKFK